MYFLFFHDARTSSSRSMPFDDSNMRKLVRYQLEKRIHFSRYKPLSMECKCLILSLLEPEIKLRASLFQIKTSDWIRGRLTSSADNDLSGSSNRSSFASIGRSLPAIAASVSPTMNFVQESAIRSMRTAQFHHHHHPPSMPYSKKGGEETNDES